MENKEKVEQLRKELQQAEQNFRTEKKNLKVNFKARKALLKGDLTKVEKTLETKKESLKSRMVWHMDSLTLRICRPFEEKAADIRYKRSDPRGYEADQIYLASGPILKHIEKKISKGKELSKKESDLASKLLLAFTAIKVEQLGHYHDKVSEVLEELKNLLIAPYSEEPSAVDKEQTKEVVGVLNDLFGVFSVKIPTLDPEPTPA